MNHWHAGYILVMLGLSVCMFGPSSNWFGLGKHRRRHDQPVENERRRS